MIIMSGHSQSLKKNIVIDNVGLTLVFTWLYYKLATIINDTP